MGGKCARVGVALVLLAFPLAGVAQARERADRTELQKRLGRQGVVDLDRRTGTPRVLARLDGTLTGVSSGTPEAIASAYVRANLATLGLTAADVAGTPSVEAQPGGVTSVQWRQAVDGIPAADHALRVNVGRDGRVLNLLGAPAHALSVPSTTPALDAGEALRAVQDDVGAHRTLVRRGGPSGARRTTTYGDDTSASLVTADGRLAWRVQYRAAEDAVYDATVDARTGKVLRRVNMVKSEAPASVWERFPGTGPGGTAAPVNLEQNGWLAAGAPILDGPNVHAYSDLNDSNSASASEEVTRVGGAFSFPLQPVSGTAGCDAAHLCSWSSSADRTLNRQQDAVQAFYFANRFHDHLAGLGFTAAEGAFQGADDLLLETMDGASTGPDGDHLNNANMFTPPDGSHPRMQMYLWSSPFRRISSGSDAAILYHEYTHGLSNRLVTDADGVGALNAPQAGAMGEAWSDFYAMDFIVGQFGALDTGAAGEVVMGAYTDVPGSTSKLRFSPLDCPPVGADPVVCPGRGAAGSGGFTYGDFGRIAGGAEVHADGEIWAQTLWDLRTALGSAKARALVTTGMALLASEPSFLDARNAIFLADQALYGGADVATLWTVFAGRGMGFFAASVGGDDTAPAESFALPPAADAPRGTITGRVTDALGGAGVPGVTVGLAGGLSGVSAVTGADGRYTIADVPAGMYLKVTAAGGGWEGATTSLSLSGGATLTFNTVVKRDWAAAKGGATITDSNGREYTEYGCGPSAAIDQSQVVGWSTTAGGDKSLVVRLPAAVDVTEFGIDPTETCGDTSSSATGSYRVETSADGTGWTIASAGTFTTAHRRRLNLLTPGAGAAGVRYARLTLLSSQGAGAQYRDLSEFAVYGTPAVTAPPETTLAPGGPPFVFSADRPATFECQVDAGPFVPCTSPFSPGPLADGEHTFTVRAVGDVTPATRTFTVDTTPPDTAIDAGPWPFRFSADEPGATFECQVDAGAYAACASPLTVLWEEGTHTLSVRAADAAGNVDPEPASRTFTIDRTGPPVTGLTGPPNRTNSRTPTFTFATAGGATLECRLSAPGVPGQYAPCTSPRTYEALGDEARYTFTVRARTADGNLGEAASREFTLDTTPPETKITSGPGARTRDRDPVFELASAPPEPRFVCTLNGAPQACSSSLALHDLADGDYVLTAAAVDEAGNVDPTPDVWRFTVDTVTPGTVVTTPTPAAPLTLALSAARVDLGTFIPGLARDYTGALTATTTGAGTLTVSDRGANAGHLVGPAGALAQPLSVRGTGGAFAPLTGTVAVPAAVEFKQPIGAGEVLRPGAYTKALTFTLAVTTP